MKIFIDSADIEKIRQVYQWGVCDGVTTNPSLLKQAVEKRKKAGEKIDMKSYIAQLLKIAAGNPVSLEVTETTAAGMIAQGKKLYALFNPVAKNVYIKIPVNPAFKEKDATHFDGITAIKALSKEKIPVNCTLVFTPEQALLAAKAGAALISPFAGRVDDYLRVLNHLKVEKSDYYPAQGKMLAGKLLHDGGVLSGIDLVRQCVQILGKYNLKAEVLAASMRNPRQVREAALVGAHIATCPFEVIQDMLKHAKTYEGMQRFTADAVEEYITLTQDQPKKKHPPLKLPDFGKVGKKLGISLDIKPVERKG